MYNRVDPITSLSQKVEQGAQLFGTIKTIYDVGTAIAPYAARAAALL